MSDGVYDAFSNRFKKSDNNQDVELKQKIHNHIADAFINLKWDPNLFYIDYAWWNTEKLIYINDYDSIKEIYAYPNLIEAIDSGEVIYKKQIE